MKIVLPLISLAFIISGCSFNTHVVSEDFNMTCSEGFLRSACYTAVKVDGKKQPGKLTLCNGYGGFISDLMKDAALVGGAALIGAGIADSGDNISNNSNSNSRAVNSAVSDSNSISSSVSNSVSGSVSSTVSGGKQMGHGWKN